MIVIHDGPEFFIVHGGRVVSTIFASEGDAWTWADDHIDDQVFDTPNDLSPPLAYFDPTPRRLVMAVNRELAELRRQEREAAPDRPDTDAHDGGTDGRG